MNRFFELTLKTSAVALAVALSGAGFYAAATHFDFIHVNADTLAQPAEPQPASVPKPAAPDEPYEEVADNTPTLEYIFVEANARVSAADGAVASLRVVGRGSQCTGEPVAPQASRQLFSTNEEAVIDSSNLWCIPIKPGSTLAYRNTGDDWTGAAGTLDTDFAANYLAYVMPSGTGGALKAAALAACDDTAGCAYALSVAAGPDDGTITALLPDAKGLTQQVQLPAADISPQSVTVPSGSPKELSRFRLTSPSIRAM